MVAQGGAAVKTRGMLELGQNAGTDCWRGGFSDLQCVVMPRKRKNAVKRYHDRVAGVYDHSYDDAYWRWHDELTWDHLKGFLPNDLTLPVIDIGCGTGKWGLKLLKSGYQVTFQDISHKMLDQARLAVKKMSGESKAMFVQGDVADLSDLPEAHFAVVTAFGEPICCSSAPAKALREIRRILRPGGVVVATFDNKLAAFDYYLSQGNLDELVRFARDGRTHWLTKEVDEQFPIKTVSPEDLRRLLEGADLRLVDMIGKFVLPVRQHRALLEDSVARRKLAKVEKSLWRSEAGLGRAAHLQIAAKPAP